MCIAAGALSILGTLGSIAGTVVGGIAQVSALQAQANQDKVNAVIAQRNAEDARNRGVEAEHQQQIKTKQMLGRQINILSERSINVGSGSALDIIGDTAMFGKMDALTIRGNYEREAIASETQRYNFLADAQQKQNASTMTMFGTGVSLFNTALGGVSDYRKVTGMTM